jgi:hypothetical protein
MISFIKRNADWFITACHSFVLFFAMFVSITDMDISGWIFVFFAVYSGGYAFCHFKKTKTFKRWRDRFKIKK